LKDEYDFAKVSLKSMAIPSPKLLVKDHKSKNKWGDVLSHLEISATNFILGNKKKLMKPRLTTPER
jgi:hypothetical protein